MQRAHRPAPFREHLARPVDYRIFSSSGGRGSPWSRQRSLPSPGARQRRCTGPETGDHRDHNGRRIVCAARARVRGIVKSRARVHAAACGRTVRLGCRHRDTLGRCSGDGGRAKGKSSLFSFFLFFLFFHLLGMWRFAPHQNPFCGASRHISTSRICRGRGGRKVAALSKPSLFLIFALSSQAPPDSMKKKTLVLNTRFTCSPSGPLITHLGPSHFKIFHR